MFRKVILSSGVIGFIPIVGAVTSAQEDQKPARVLVRPSDLPIYEPPSPDIVRIDSGKQPKESLLRSIILPPVSAVREQLQVVWEQTDLVKHTIQDNYHELQDRTDWLVKYFREEENKEIRYGAVAMGGLTGYIFGLRGGIIRRLLYTGAGVTAMGFVCFPEETKELAKSNGILAKQYINIAYNFLYGVKPGDPQLELKFPEFSFPKDFSEFFDQTISLASTITKAVMPPPNKESNEPKPSEKKN